MVNWTAPTEAPQYRGIMISPDKKLIFHKKEGQRLYYIYEGMIFIEHIMEIQFVTPIATIEETSSHPWLKKYGKGK